MRPIRLKIAGLNSFKEQQEIDFEQLCLGGVFGIFGPTGSGKSSILDAITLALYGKVERAPSNTTGIMNHATDRLSVSFTFSLRNAHGEKHYTVERTYKRAEEHRLHQLTSRLIEVGQTDVVISDKAKEVTAQVEGILGLNVDDFTRAVVLPQGKFAEFITLTGGERRKMLQRLFHLEKYGERLTERVLRQRETAKGKENELKAEQAGLGDCSQEHVDQLQQRLQVLTEEENRRRKQLQEIERELAEKKEVWQRQNEKATLERTLAGVKAREQDVERLSAKLEQAKQAERLQPYLEELDRNEQEEKHWSREKEESHGLYEQARHVHTAELATYTLAREKRTTDEPQLVHHIETLKVASELQSQIEQATIVYEQQKVLLATTLQQEEGLRGQLQTEQQALAAAKKLQADLQVKLMEVVVKEEERTRLTQAWQRKQSYDYAHKEYAQRQLEKEKLHTQRLELEQKGVELQEHANVVHEALRLEVERLHAIDASFVTFEKALLEHERLIAVMMEQEKAKLSQLEKLHLAAILAEQLHEGDACLVCGSTSHPHLATPTVETSEGTDRLTALEARLHDNKERLLELKQYRYTIAQLGLRFAHLEELTERLQAKTAASLDDADMHTTLMDEATIDTQMRTLAEQMQLTMQTIEHRLTDLDKAERAIAEWQVRSTHIQQQHAEALQKEAVVQKDVEQQLEEWRQSYPDLAPETIAATIAAIEQRAQEAEKLQERIAKSGPYLEEKEKAIQQLEADLHRYSLEATRLDADAKAKATSLQEQKERLAQMTSGAEVAALLQTATTQLEQIQLAEERARSAFEQSEKQLRQEENRYTVAEQSLALATKQRVHAQLQWEKQLKQSSFAHRDAVVTAFLDRATQATMQAEVDRYVDEVKQLEITIKGLVTALGGKELSEAEWERIVQAEQAIKREYEASIEERARAKRDYEDVQQKHIRWQKIELERLHVVKQYEQLQQLYTVLRGNALVDFIAEEQLVQISRDASARLGSLTRGRYALEIDSSGAFVVRDDANGGVKRAVTTLSGGETFLTSLALALSLSAQVQLRGQYPLEFFFLDEGFGTLDQELLETVVSALEKLHSASLTVGVISHVPELRERLNRKLIVTPAQADGQGSTVRLEIM